LYNILINVFFCFQVDNKNSTSLELTNDRRVTRQANLRELCGGGGPRCYAEKGSMVSDVTQNYNLHDYGPLFSLGDDCLSAGVSRGQKIPLLSPNSVMV